MSKRKRLMGDILLDLEAILLEMVDHGLQWGDIIFQIYGYLMIHCPGAREKYTKGGHPVLYYGPDESKSNEEES